MEVDFITLLTIFIRISVFISICKSMFPPGTNMKLKMGLSLILSYIIFLSIKDEIITSEIINYNFIILIINEIITGYLLALITNIIFDILNFSGALIDNSIGLSMAAVFDTNINGQITLTGKILYYTSITIYFLSNGHHILIKALITSFINLNPGKSIFVQESLMKLIELIISYFTIGIKIALPIIFITLLTEICMGLISRIIPQINVMVLGVPLKILVGLLILALGLPVLIKVFLNIANNIPNIFEKILVFSMIILGKNTFIVYAQEEKTEEPTFKKKQDARKKGELAKSKDVSLTITMIGFMIIIYSFISSIVNNFSEMIIKYLSNLDMNLSNTNINNIKNDFITKILINILIFAIPIIIFGVIGNIIQTGFLISKEPLKPSLNKLNPINGFKNIFSKKNIFSIFKNIILIIITSYISYIYIKNQIPTVFKMINYSIITIGQVSKKIVMGIFNQILILSIVLSALDYFIQYRAHKKTLKMTKYEIKQEYKEMEGNPQIKSKIKQKQREISQKRMMNDVPNATAIIANPTHLAIAIKYDENNSRAPIVVAKGKNLIALKIKDIAKENNVPIIENKPLARAMYNKIEIGDEIPEEFYQAVSKILAIIYMDKKR